ncbi:formate dehydrogenase subunit gamma [Massilia sp. DWR3-1-1]|uniref:formate dehydrogenase subunit gamma n=1 Tax=Massilia sp. DWR3-1-1 TaxID=2804559 RepID=UPI003CEBB99C
MNPPDPHAAFGDILDLHARHGHLGQDALLPVLHAIQDRLGFIPPDAVEYLAQSFNVSRAEVHGVITFYHYFKTAAPARCTVQICRAEACQSMGGDALLAHAERNLGCGLHAHTADGAFALEPVYCLGQCATAPAIMINDAVHARVTPARFDKLIGKIKEVA